MRGRSPGAACRLRAGDVDRARAAEAVDVIAVAGDLHAVDAVTEEAHAAAVGRPGLARVAQRRAGDGDEPAARGALLDVGRAAVVRREDRAGERHERAAGG